jgi:hypothetical protein
MTNANPEFDNSFVTIHNKEIDIHYRKKRIKVGLDKVAKMYLAKKKSKYCTWFPGISNLIDNEYNFCIKTQDDKEISFEVKASEKQYFIDPISFIRKMKKNQQSLEY